MEHPGPVRAAFVLVVVIGCAALALGAETASAQRAPARQVAAASTIVGRMGVEMTESDARHAIAFTPFSPPRHVLAVALLPPFHGDDVRANRGIGFEYADAGNRRYALAEWPANGGSIERFALRDATESDCAGARTFARGSKPNGIVWSTPHGLIMTLQADGASDARTLEREWRKLIRRGVCR